jgi:hypothetical protein
LENEYRTKIGSDPFVRHVAQIWPQPRTGGVPGHPASGDANYQNPNGNLTGALSGKIALVSVLQEIHGFQRYINTLAL